jgi:hypothetical protein
MILFPIDIDLEEEKEKPKNNTGKMLTNIDIQL